MPIRERTYERDGRTWTRYRATFELPPDRATGQRRRLERTFSTHDEAVDWLAAQRKRAQAPRPRARLTVRDLLEEWVAANAAEWSPAHLERTRRIVAHDLDALHRIRIDRLTKDDVEALIRGRREVVADNSVRLARNALRAALNFAIADRKYLVGPNVASLAKMPRIAEARPVFLKPDEVRRLLDVLEGHFYEPLILTTMLLALRPSEAIGLRWSDVELDGPEPHVTIRRNLQYIAGQYHDREKTKDEEERVIPLPADLAALLRAHRLRDVVGTDNLVFHGKRAGTPVYEKYVSNVVLRELCAEAGIPRISMYKLRHTGATLRLILGAPIERVADALGHSNIQMTRRYAHVVDELRRQDADLLDGFLRGSGGTDGGTGRIIPFRGPDSESAGAV